MTINPKKPPILSQRQLNRALLARQLLLQREPLSVPRGLERIAGLQAQYAPSMYIGLWSRLAGFRRADLDRALAERTVVQGTLMRATIHLVSAADYWPFAMGIGRSRREWWLKVRPEHPSAAEMEAAAQSLRSQLNLGQGQLRRAEIDHLLGLGSAGTNGVGLWLDLIRVPPSGTWERRRADLFAAAADWLGPPQVTEEEGLAQLARSYLRAFGPASLKDLADWAGLPVKVAAVAAGRLQLRRYLSEAGQELVDLPGAPLPAAETPAPVRFLPAWDATLLVHARRSGILPERFRPRVFNTKTPQSVSTFLVDGAVAGIWRYEKGEVRLTPFERLDPAVQRELEAEAERLALIHV